MFAVAEASIWEAKASVEYIRPEKADVLSDPDYIELTKWFVIESLKEWRTNVAEANMALARLAPYNPAVLEHLPFCVSRLQPLNPQLVALVQGSAALSAPRHGRPPHWPATAIRSES